MGELATLWMFYISRRGIVRIPSSVKMLSTKLLLSRRDLGSDRSRLTLSRSELHWCNDTLVTPRLLHANIELLMISSTPDLESSSLSYVHNLYKLCIAVQ